MKRRLLTVGPDNEPLWVRLYVQPYGDHWAAMLVGDEVPLPDPSRLTGLTFFGAIRDAVAWGAKATQGRYGRLEGTSYRDATDVKRQNTTPARAGPVH